MFFAAVVMSYAIALLFSLAFEMPFLHVDKLIFGERKKTQKKNNDNTRKTIVAKNITQIIVAEENDLKRAVGQQQQQQQQQSNFDIGNNNVTTDVENINEQQEEKFNEAVEKTLIIENKIKISETISDNNPNAKNEVEQN